MGLCHGREPGAPGHHSRCHFQRPHGNKSALERSRFSLAPSGLRHPRSQAWLSHPCGNTGADPEPPKSKGISPLTPARLGSDPPVPHPHGKTVFPEFPGVERFQSFCFLISPSLPLFNFFPCFFSLLWHQLLWKSHRRNTIRMFSSLVAAFGIIPRNWAAPYYPSFPISCGIVIRNSRFIR